MVLILSETFHQAAKHDIKGKHGLLLNQTLKNGLKVTSIYGVEALIAYLFNLCFSSTENDVGCFSLV